mmetsp:Transcript_21123/g.68338  ORF Transcript_21123/g.68338 Transcript_21123/m.68338 type:complete len:306 (+) Transcript_21123:995-1912(+)
MPPGVLRLTERSVRRLKERLSHTKCRCYAEGSNTDRSIQRNSIQHSMAHLCEEACGGSPPERGWFATQRTSNACRVRCVRHHSLEAFLVQRVPASESEDGRVETAQRPCFCLPVSCVCRRRSHRCGVKLVEANGAHVVGVEAKKARGRVLADHFELFDPSIINVPPLPVPHAPPLPPILPRRGERLRDLRQSVGVLLRPREQVEKGGRSSRGRRPDLRLADVKEEIRVHERLGRGADQSGNLAPRVPTEHGATSLGSDGAIVRVPAMLRRLPTAPRARHRGTPVDRTKHAVSALARIVDAVGLQL